MAQTIPLKLVIDLGGGSEFFDSVSDSDQDIVYPWPGTPVIFDLTCEPPLIQPVWIGVSEDGNDSQAYPLTTSVEDILAAGWAHVYQGTEIADCDGNVTVYSNQYNHVLLAIAACCNSNFPTQALALKESIYALTPGVTYPCGGESAFKWLAIYGASETLPNLQYIFTVSLINDDGSVVLATTPIVTNPFTETVQLTKNWPEDFVGMIIDGITLVDNDTAPLAGERQVKDFDGGTIEVGVLINDLDAVTTIKEDLKTFALLDTDCQENESGIFEDQFEIQFE